MAGTEPWIINPRKKINNSLKKIFNNPYTLIWWSLSSPFISFFRQKLYSLYSYFCQNFPASLIYGKTSLFLLISISIFVIAKMTKRVTCAFDHQSSRSCRTLIIAKFLYFSFSFSLWSSCLLPATYRFLMLILPRLPLCRFQ